MAEDLGLEHTGIENLGATWYSTPEQFRLVSYLTLFGIAYLSEEEFTPSEKDGTIGQHSWPEWHYRVVFLYAQGLMLDHLASTYQINLIKLTDSIDHDVEDEKASMEDKIILHSFDEYYYYNSAKIQTDIRDPQINITDTKQVRGYALKLGRMASSLTAEKIQLELKNALQVSKKT